MRISDWSSDVCSSDLRSRLRRRADPPQPAQPHQSVRPVSQAVAILIDARGLKCPWPALRLARAVRQAGGGCFDLIAEDPAAQRDIPRLAAENGWQLEAFPAEIGRAHV